MLEEGRWINNAGGGGEVKTEKGSGDLMFNTTMLIT